MALIWKDRVLELATTTGTGAFTLGGAMTGYRTFASVCATSDTVYYLIEAVDASGYPTGEWETGLGTYSGTNTLTRTTPLDSSTGSAVSFSAGDKRVALTQPASVVSSVVADVGFGAWRLAASWDFSVSGSTALPLAFTGLGTFEDLLITFNGVTISSSSTLLMRVSTDNGSSWYTTSGNYVRWSTGNHAAQTSFLLGSALTTFSRAMPLVNCKQQPAVLTTAGNNTGNPSEMFLGSTSPINAIQLLTASGTPNLTAGVIRLLTR